MATDTIPFRDDAEKLTIARETLASIENALEGLVVLTTMPRVERDELVRIVTHLHDRVVEIQREIA